MSAASVWGYAVRGAGDETVEIDLYDRIGASLSEPGFTAKDARALLRGNANAKTIRLRINSAGGDVVDGLSIYNQLIDHPARVIVEVDALAASMASVIAMAGDERRMASNATLMVHDPWGLAVGKSDELRRHADLLDKLRGHIADIYAERSGQSRRDVLAAMKEETWMTADEAEEAGYVHTITPSKAIAVAAAWDLGRFANTPQALRAMTDVSGGARTEGTMERRYNELTLSEKHRLANDDPEAFARLRAEWIGRPYEAPRNTTLAAMSLEEKHLLANRAPEIYARMKADPSFVVT